MLPTYDEIVALHKKYAPSEAAYKAVFTHCQVVRDIALQLAANLSNAIDKELVVAGCLLHDVGYYPILDADGLLKEGRLGVEHGLLGEEILRKEKLPETLCRICSHHTGSGLFQDDIIARDLPLPHKDFLAKTNEEKLVMYADKFHSKHKNTATFNTYEWYEHYVSQFGDKNVASFRALAALFGKPDLTLLIKKYGHEVRDI